MRLCSGSRVETDLDLNLSRISEAFKQGNRQMEGLVDNGDKTKEKQGTNACKEERI